MNRKSLSAGRRIAVALLFTSALTAFGWGQKGHDIVAAIASRHLTPTAEARAREILDGKSLVYWSHWLDNASHTPQYEYTKTWHYRNVDADENFDSAKLNPKGDVLRAIEAQKTILSDPASRPKDLSLALKILIHTMGDLHQPMHLGHLSDLGGNKWKILWFGQDKNLHSIWDTQMVESAHKWSHTEWVEEIDTDDAETIATLVMGGNTADWGRESHALASRIYATTPQGSKLSYDYISAWTPTIEGQLLKGGLRLAWILNRLFDPESTDAATTGNL